MTVPAMQLLAAKTATAGGFEPTDVAGCTLWLDASDTATITATGSNVTAWADKSSSGYDMTATGTPQTGTRTINSLNTIAVSSGNHFIRANTPINNASDGSWTVFVVCVTDQITSTASIIDGDTNFSIRVGQYIRRDSATLQSIGFTSAGSPVTDSGSTLSTATPYLLRSVNTGSSVEVFANGVSGGSTAMASQRYLSTAPLGIGTAADGAAQPLGGIIGEVLAYSLDLDAGDITTIEDYLSTKWGL